MTGVCIQGLGRAAANCLVAVLLLLLADSPSSAGTGHVLFLPHIERSCPTPPVPTASGWLEYTNFYRATACLPPVADNAAWSDGDYKHARYIVKNDVLEHNEDPGNPWYTPEGHAAAQQSNLAASYDVNETDTWAIDTLMQAPFHAVGILDPQLIQVGYGSYREADGNLQMGAALNVIAGLTYTVNATYPVLWPGNRTTVPISLHWGEYPSPLTSCPGYTAPAGLPLIVQIGPGNLVPVVQASSFVQNGQALPHCTFDETSYTNPVASEQNLGRAILNARDAIVLIPRSPLLPGATYTASITVGLNVHTWSFTVSSDAHLQETDTSWRFVR